MPDTVSTRGPQAIGALGRFGRDLGRRLVGTQGTARVGIFGAGSLGTQLVGIVAIGAFVVVTSAIVWLALKFTLGIRVSEEEEHAGLDTFELGQEAYPEFGRGSQAI